MRKDQPRSFRLAPEVIEALKWLHDRTGESLSGIVSRLVLEAAAAKQREDVATRLASVEARLARLEGGEG